MLVFDDAGVVIGENVEVNGKEIFRSVEELVKKLGLVGGLNIYTGEFYVFKGLEPTTRE